MCVAVILARGPPRFDQPILASSENRAALSMCEKSQSLKHGLRSLHRHSNTVTGQFLLHERQADGWHSICLESNLVDVVTELCPDAEC